MQVLKRLRKRFNQIADTYDEYAVIHREVAKRLAERFQYLKIKPQCILDLGAGTGFLTQELQKLFPKAHIIALDSAHQMLINAKKKQSLFKGFSLLEANVEDLPIANQSVDVIVFTGLWPYLQDIEKFIKECHRVLKVDGLLMMTSFGPDTFKEWREAFEGIDNAKHTHDFMDMHDIGDAILRAGFIDPVMDRQDVCLNYRTFDGLLKSMRHQGVHFYSNQRLKGLLGRQAWHQVQQNYPLMDDKFPLTYEILFGHAWRGKDKTTGQVVSLQRLKELLPSKDSKMK